MSSQIAGYEAIGAGDAWLGVLPMSDIVGFLESELDRAVAALRAAPDGRQCGCPRCCALAGSSCGNANAGSESCSMLCRAAIYTTDAEGRISFFNESTAELWGCRPEIGESAWCGSWKLFWSNLSSASARSVSHGYGRHQGKPNAIRNLDAVDRATRRNASTTSCRFRHRYRDASGAVNSRCRQHVGGHL